MVTAALVMTGCGEKKAEETAEAPAENEETKKEEEE